MALSARRVTRGQLTVGDLVAINGILLQLHMPLTSLGFTYQEIRQSLTDLKQLLQLLSRTPSVVSDVDAPQILVTGNGRNGCNVCAEDCCTGGYVNGSTGGSTGCLTRAVHQWLHWLSRRSLR